jgi:hypothetical protein
MPRASRTSGCDATDPKGSLWPRRRAPASLPPNVKTTNARAVVSCLSLGNSQEGRLSELTADWQPLCKPIVWSLRLRCTEESFQ